jgi:hypothetical protein
MMEEIEPKEQDLKSAPSQKSNLTLQQVIDFGEYNPKFLSNFAEWHTLSPHIQWQLVRKALDIRQKQLYSQYAELNNVLDFSKKPRIWDALKNLEKQIKHLAEDRESLYIEFTNKM